MNGSRKSKGDKIMNPNLGIANERKRNKTHQ